MVHGLRIIEQAWPQLSTLGYISPVVKDSTSTKHDFK